MTAAMDDISSDVEVELQHLVVEPGLDSDPNLKIRVRNMRKLLESGDPILSEVCFDVPTGLVVGIMGPSGSGKSTLLRVLNRLWEPDRGSVFLDGQDICNLDVLSLRRRVGMLFQLPVLFPGTVADNVRYGPQLRGRRLTDMEVSTLLALADLDDSFADRDITELSVGQAQRVALARTLANEPEVLLLDEPTSALDPISTQKIEETIVRLKQSRRMTTVVVSHSIRQIERIADVACVLIEGQMVEALKPNELYLAKHPMARRFLQLSS